MNSNYQTSYAVQRCHDMDSVFEILTTYEIYKLTNSMYQDNSSFHVVNDFSTLKRNKALYKEKFISMCENKLSM